MYELKVKGDIASAHQLRGYEGRCKNLHGHTWKIEVTLLSQTLDNIGMVADFRVMKKMLKEVLAPIDHVCLNDLPFFQDVNPTTENIAKYVYQKFSVACVPLKVKQVEVWESDLASSVYYE
ncbi:MAG: 6-carboxytetrahydropterin synthase QueD [Candidatus Omnitrophica bacterium]|nr:6-carboxytetrahydropterin synthase QueD [Candidatus Omnitrophota bacterium]